MFSSDKERYVLELIIELLGFPAITPWQDLPLWGAINPLLNKSGRVVEPGVIEAIYEKRRQPSIASVGQTTLVLSVVFRFTRFECISDVLVPSVVFSGAVLLLLQLQWIC